MLLQNETLWSQYPIRLSAGRDPGQGSGSIVAFQDAGKVSTSRYIGEAGLSPYLGLPAGTSGSDALIQPLHAGGLATFLTGSSSVSAGLVGEGRISASLSGSGTVTTLLVAEAALVARLSGSGALLPVGLAGWGDIAASLSGSSSFLATLTTPALYEALSPVVFFHGSQAGRQGLGIQFRDGAGNPYDPAYVSYDVFHVGEDVTTQMLPASRRSEHPAVGEFYALESFFAWTYPVGSYQIRWKWRVDSGGVLCSRTTEFAVVARG